MAKSARRRPKGAGSVFQRGGKGNWILEYTDEGGVRRTRSSRTKDRALALRMLSKITEEVEQVRSGLMDREALVRRTAGREGIEKHLEAYLDSCEAGGLSANHLKQSRAKLLSFLEGEKVGKIDDLTPAKLDHYLTGMSKAGKSAATCNRYRAAVLAFSRWLHRVGLAPDLKLGRIPKRNESRDRRLERRPLTDGEVERLFEVAQGKGSARELFYGLALFAGLRRSEVKNLLWRDVDLDGLTLQIIGGKGRAVDAVPIHPVLAELLEAHRGTEEPEGPSPVLRPFPTNKTRLKDFERAGLVRSTPVLDGKGAPVLDSRGRPRVQYVPADGGEKDVDYHSLRFTFATRLARSGMPPLIVKKLMRHSSFSVTEQHYIHLELEEARQALGEVPVRTEESAGATEGTTGSAGAAGGTTGSAGATPTPVETGEAGGAAAGPQSIPQSVEVGGPARDAEETEGRSRGRERSQEAQVLLASFRSLSPTLDRMLSKEAREGDGEGGDGLGDRAGLRKSRAGGCRKGVGGTPDSLYDSLRRLRSLLLTASDETLRQVAEGLFEREE